MLRLAEYQVRLLLCRPAWRYDGRIGWHCGCSADRCGPHKFAVTACGYHAPLLCQVPEGDDWYEGSSVGAVTADFRYARKLLTPDTPRN
jgi:hypothetical protein